MYRDKNVFVVKENVHMTRVADVLTAPEKRQEEGQNDSSYGHTGMSTEGRTAVEVTAKIRLLAALSELQMSVEEEEARQQEQWGMVVEGKEALLAGALGCVKRVLGNIALHPDDEKLRRIRVNHPAIRVSVKILSLALSC